MALSWTCLPVPGFLFLYFRHLQTICVVYIDEKAIPFNNMEQESSLHQDTPMMWTRLQPVLVGWASILVSIADNQLSPQALKNTTTGVLHWHSTKKAALPVARKYSRPGWFCLIPFRLPFRGLLIFKWFMTKVAIKVVLFMSHPLLYFLIAHMCLWAEFLRAASSRRIRSFNCIPLNENRMSPWRAWLRGRWLFHTKLMLVSLTSWKTIVASTRTASKGAWWILNSCSIGQRKASKTHRETFAVRQPFNTPKHQNCYSQNTTVSHRIKAQVTVHRTVWSTSEVENHWNCADVHYKDASRWHFQDQTDSSKAFLRPVLCLTWHMDAHGINPLEEMLALQSTKSFFVMHLTKLISFLSDSSAFGMHKDLA